MRRLFRPTLAAVSFGVALALASPVRAGGAEASSAADAAMDVDEARCAALASSLSGRIAAMNGPSRDRVHVQEAEEIGAVAEELLEEGDAALARALFEEAIALLDEDDG